MMNNRISRRAWLAANASAAVGLACMPAFGDKPTTQLDIIDCHTHFYDPTRPEGIPWPGKGSSLYRTVLPKHLRAEKQFRKVTDTVIVEASPRVEDNTWLLGIAKDDPFVVGIVGNLELGSQDFAKNVKRFAANPLFRGIRVGSRAVTRVLETKSFDDLKRLADHDLSLDVNGGPDTPGIVAKLAAQMPKLRIVQNHIGNVHITENAPPKDWQAGIEAAASHPNVFIKISALVSGAARNGKKAPDDMTFYKPYIDVVWNAFGDDRVIYGSDWPVSDRAASYHKQQRIIMEYAAIKGERATKNFCSLNAKKAYKWVERPGRL